MEIEIMAKSSAVSPNASPAPVTENKTRNNTDQAAAQAAGGAAAQEPSAGTSSGPGSAGQSGLQSGTASGDTLSVGDGVHAVGTLGASTGPSPSISSITQPEAAVAALKTKTSELHKVVNDIGHVGSVAVADIQALLSDMGFLVNFIHSKL
jgi:hypothetical protein